MEYLPENEDPKDWAIIKELDEINIGDYVSYYRIKPYIYKSTFKFKGDEKSQSESKFYKGGYVSIIGTEVEKPFVGFTAYGKNFSVLWNNDTIFYKSLKPKPKPKPKTKQKKSNGNLE